MGVDLNPTELQQDTYRFVVSADYQDVFPDELTTLSIARKAQQLDRILQGVFIAEFGIEDLRFVNFLDGTPGILTFAVGVPAVIRMVRDHIASGEAKVFIEGVEYNLCTSTQLQTCFPQVLPTVPPVASKSASSASGLTIVGIIFAIGLIALLLVGAAVWFKKRQDVYAGGREVVAFTSPMCTCIWP